MRRRREQELAGGREREREKKKTKKDARKEEAYRGGGRRLGAVRVRVRVRAVVVVVERGAVWPVVVFYKVFRYSSRMQASVKTPEPAPQPRSPPAAQTLHATPDVQWLAAASLPEMSCTV